MTCQNGKQMSREQLLEWIDMVSFGAYDTLLYLNTHPQDCTAMEYYKECIKMRKQALEDYARMYAPLTADTACMGENDWQWTLSKWPWEGGAC